MFKSKTSTLSYDETPNSNEGDRNATPVNPKEKSQTKHLNIPGDRSRHSSIADSKRSSSRYDGGYSADIIPAQLRFIDNIDYGTRLRKHFTETLWFQMGTINSVRMTDGISTYSIGNISKTISKNPHILKYLRKRKD